MKVKTIVNGKGEPQARQIEIQIEGSGGELGKRAVIMLSMLINGLKDTKTEEELYEHLYVVFGFALCCQECGFMTEKSTAELMHMAEHAAENEAIRIQSATDGDGADG